MRANASTANPGNIILTTSGPGLVGIGTSNPSYKLDVAGQARIAGSLVLDGGEIRVTGAGLGTSTPVFIHQATSSNIDGSCTTIDHPLTNGAPNAILIVTEVKTYYTDHPIFVYYEIALGRWRICQPTFKDIHEGQMFNVLVVKP